MIYNQTTYNCNENVRWPFLWEHINTILRVWGIITALVLFAVGVDFAYHREGAGIFTLVSSALVFFFEIIWALTLLFQICIRNENHPFFDCWEAIQWIDLWKKSIIYLVLSLIISLDHHRLWLSLTAASFLVLLAIGYLFLTYKTRIEAKVSILEAQDDYSERFDDVVQGEVDDSLPEPLQQISVIVDLDNTHNLPRGEHNQ